MAVSKKQPVKRQRRETMSVSLPGDLKQWTQDRALRLDVSDSMVVREALEALKASEIEGEL